MVAYSDATKPQTAWLEWGGRKEEAGMGEDKEDGIGIFLFLAFLQNKIFRYRPMKRKKSRSSCTLDFLKTSVVGCGGRGEVRGQEGEANL